VCLGRPEPKPAANLLTLDGTLETQDHLVPVDVRPPDAEQLASAAPRERDEHDRRAQHRVVHPDVAPPPFEVVAHGHRTDVSVATFGLDQEPGQLALGGSTCAVDRPRCLTQLKRTFLRCRSRA